MEDYILQKIKNKENVAIVGETDSGKTWFINNELMPFLEKQGIKAAYFEDCDKIDNSSQADCFIVDEVETLFDKKRLEEKYGQDYYNNDYLVKVADWHKKLSIITKPAIFIVTRNAADVEYLVENYKKLEWNQFPVRTIEFFK